MNPYAYAGSDPVNGWDPSGLARADNWVCVTWSNGDVSCKNHGGGESGAHVLDPVTVTADATPWGATANFLNPDARGGFALSSRSPASGPPEGSGWFRDGGEDIFRRFGPDGRAAKDLAWNPRDHGVGRNHAHDWDWSRRPPRPPMGRPLGPQDLPDMRAAFGSLLEWLAKTGTRLPFMFMVTPADMQCRIARGVCAGPG